MLRTKASDESDISLLRSALQETSGANSLEMREGSVEVTVPCKPPTTATEPCLVLRLMLEWQGSTAASTYHIYFDARPDAEAIREKWEQVLNDPDTSALRKEIAAAGLKKLDEKLERKRRPD